VGVSIRVRRCAPRITGGSVRRSLDEAVLGRHPRCSGRLGRMDFTVFWSAAGGSGDIRFGLAKPAAVGRGDREGAGEGGG
jgi:hypothetical protein